MSAETFPAGSVVIAGAGPGAADLLTVRALDRLRRAEVVLHDALVEAAVLDLVPPTARLIDVGRRAHAGGCPQALATALMIHEAREGRRVLRLHAGDAFVFGRGGEELLALRDAGVSYELVPGVSAALSAATAAEIPLTLRGVARGFSVRTGHTATGPVLSVERDEETVVILMGLGAIREICAAMIAEGRDPKTPAAVVASAFRPQERALVATLQTLADVVERESLCSPVTIIIGEVVAHAKPAAATNEGDLACA